VLDLQFSTAPVHLSLVDHTSTGEGSDTVAGFHEVYGTDYADVITGDDSPNVLRGGKGDDVLDGAGGDDQLDGEDGNNTASFASSPNGVTANFEQATGDGTDTLDGLRNLEGSPFDDTLSLIDGEISGMAGDDTFVGNQWHDNFNGGTGDDHFLLAQGGADQIEAGPGQDTVTYEQFTQAVDVDLDLGHATSSDTTATTFLDTPEVLIGTPDDDTITGSSGSDTIDGLAGDDTVQPGEGDDQITTGDGIDTISYADVHEGVRADLASGQATGAGVDTFLDAPEALNGSPYDDHLTGSPQADTVDGLAGNDTLLGLAGDDHLTGGPGIDTIDFAAAVHGVIANLTTGKASGQGLDTLSGVEDVAGSLYDDTLVGNELGNVLAGRGGNDRLTGLGGPDQYAGGAGVDLVDFAAANRGVTADLTKGTARGQGADTLVGVESLIGSRFSDTLLGSATANLLQGAPGADLLDGRGGRDTLFGNNGPDLLVGGQGTDACFGGPGADRATSCEAKGSIP